MPSPEKFHFPASGQSEEPEPVEPSPKAPETKAERSKQLRAEIDELLETATTAEEVMPYLTLSVKYTENVFNFTKKIAAINK